jgi:transcription-repair coupling factor (superfamily II helicase)
MLKIEMYQKLSNADNDEDIEDVIDEFIDRFGEIPKETMNLIEIVKLRNRCRKIGIKEVKIVGDFLYFMDNTKNHIKYRLTNGAKSDILCFVNHSLGMLEQTVK